MLNVNYLKLLLFLSGAIMSLSSYADYQYDIIEKNGHKFHVVIIDPKQYEVSLEVACGQVFGREEVSDIAKRNKADIAINAGFFEIGGNQDGRPTGTLVSKGQVFGMRVSKHGCLVKRGDNFSIEIITPFLEIDSGSKIFRPKKFNRFATGKDIFYFNHHWGQTTLSVYNERKEVIINEKLKIIDIVNHGNNEIPDKGYVLSFPAQFDLSFLTVGQQLKFSWNPEYLAENDSFALMGLPVLITENKIAERLSNRQKHARTAIGITKDGKLVLVLAKHYYIEDISKLNVADVKAILDKNNISINNFLAADIKKMVVEDLTSDNSPQGVSMRQLAEFMQEMGCRHAINLDGGGSSAMYIDEKYVNQSFGDSEEAPGQKIFRPVSDALIFKKRK
jgi:exopolysaccharide biosynthesis protein